MRNLDRVIAYRVIFFTNYCHILLTYVATLTKMTQKYDYIYGAFSETERERKRDRVVKNVNGDKAYEIWVCCSDDIHAFTFAQFLK